jgi:hypothetical protein
MWLQAVGAHAASLSFSRIGSVRIISGRCGKRELHQAAEALYISIPHKPEVSALEESLGAYSCGGDSIGASD